MFLVAELGCNWNGNYAVAYDLIRRSKDAGFDAVKFAVFNKDHWGKSQTPEKLRSNTLTETSLRHIYGICKNIEIEFFATPCYPEAVEMLNPYVKRFKIRYKDRFNNRILNRILETKKSCIISGRHYRNPDFWSVYCIPDYPTNPDQVDFREMKNWHGFSSHSPEPFILKSALRIGLKYYEIHMVLDHSREWIDEKVSLDFKQVKRIFREFNIKKELTQFWN